MDYASVSMASILSALLMACSSGTPGAAGGGESANPQALQVATGTWVSARGGADGFHQVTLSVNGGQVTKAKMVTVSQGASYGVERGVSPATLSESLPTDGVSIELKDGTLKVSGLRSMTENLPQSMAFESVDTVLWSGHSPGTMSQLRVSMPNSSETFLLSVLVPIGFSSFNGYAQAGVFVDHLRADVFTFAYDGNYGYKSGHIFSKESPRDSKSWMTFVAACATPQTITVAAGTFKTCVEEQADEFKVWYGNVPGGIVKLERSKAAEADLPRNARDIMSNGRLLSVQSWELETVVY